MEHDVASEDQTLDDLKKLKESIDNLSSGILDCSTSPLLNGNVNGNSPDTFRPTSPVSENGQASKEETSTADKTNGDTMVSDDDADKVKESVKESSIPPRISGAESDVRDTSYAKENKPQSDSSLADPDNAKGKEGNVKVTINDMEKAQVKGDMEKGQVKGDMEKGQAKSDRSASGSKGEADVVIVKEDNCEATLVINSDAENKDKINPPSKSQVTLSNDKDKALGESSDKVEDDDVVLVSQELPKSNNSGGVKPSLDEKSSKLSTSTSKPPTQSDNLRPMAKNLYDLGLDLCRQQVYKDLIKIQRKKSSQSKLGDKEEKQLNKLKVAYDNILTKNDPYQMDLIVCEMCGFNTESANVMELHKEFAHHRSDGSQTCECAFCDFVSPAAMPSMFFLHMESIHGRKGRIHMRLALCTCPYCPFENNSRRAYHNHVQRCEKKFIMNRNLEPSSNDSDIPLQQPKRPTPPLIPRTSAMPAPRPPMPSVPRNVTPQLRATAPGASINVRSGLMPVPNAAGPRGQQLFQVGSSLYTLVHSQGQAFLTPVVPGSSVPNNTARTVPVKHGSMPPQVIASPGANKVKNLLPPVSAPQPPQPKPKPAVSKPQPKASPAGPNFEVCEICGGFVKDRESLRIHFFYAHKVELSPDVFNHASGPHLKCDMCTQRFWTYQGVVRHTQTQHGSKASSIGSITCGICGENNLPMGMLGHLVARHNVSIRKLIELNKCFLCKTAFPVHFLLKMHMLKNHKDVIPSTTVFAAFLKSLGLSKAFMPVASSDISPKPNASGAHPLNKNALTPIRPQAKQMTSIEIKTRKRKLSDKTEVHQIAEVNPSAHPYKCSRCNKRFPFPEVMQKHFNDVHRNEKEKCELCDSVITIGRPMVRHMKREHLGECSVVLVRLSRKEYFYHVSKYRKRAEAAAKNKLQCSDSSSEGASPNKKAKFEDISQNEKDKNQHDNSICSSSGTEMDVSKEAVESVSDTSGVTQMSGDD